MFKEPSVKDRPQISQPTLMASTATQASAPLVVTVTPSRAAPKVHEEPGVETSLFVLQRQITDKQPETSEK